MRSQTEFPIKGYEGLCAFLHTAWSEGWLDEYSEDHFLIRAIEGRLDVFVGKEQLIENDLNLQGIIHADGSVDMESFHLNFCINFSNRMRFLMQKFGRDSIRRFMENQMSAGKKYYEEDAFFQALSEISVLSFQAGMHPKFQMTYEPPVGENGSKKNPEARLSGLLRCRVDNGSEAEQDRMVTINSDGLTQMAMADFKAKTETEREEAIRLGNRLVELVYEYRKTD